MKSKVLSVLIAAFTILSATHGMMPSIAAAQSSEEKKLEALADIRRELACYCGCSLTVEDCLRSMRCSESAKLSQQVIDFTAAGKNKAEIIQAMVASYGETILSAPTKKGFNLMAWILPFAALGIGGAIAVVVVKRWNSKKPPLIDVASRASTENQALLDPYAQKVEEELKQLEK
jgi:cytochrome c-type biogenesis protein CcmH